MAGNLFMKQIAAFSWQFTGKEKVLLNLIHTDATYFIPDTDYFVRVMEATFVYWNFCKTMKNVLGHTHVMILCYYCVHWERGGLIWGWGHNTKERVSGLKISKDLSIPHTLYIISELTQQDGRKKRTANRLCVTNVTRLYLGCFVVILTNINVFGSFTKRSV